MRRTLVEEDDDFLEGLEEVHVLVAVLLYTQHEGQLRLGGLGRLGQEGGVGLQVFHGLLRYQVLLLVPLHRLHHRVPDLSHTTQHTTHTVTGQIQHT